MPLISNAELQARFRELVLLAFRVVRKIQIVIMELVTNRFALRAQLNWYRNPSILCSGSVQTKEAIF